MDFESELKKMMYEQSPQRVRELQKEKQDKKEQDFFERKHNMNISRKEYKKTHPKNRAERRKLK